MLRSTELISFDDNFPNLCVTSDLSTVAIVPLTAEGFNKPAKLQSASNISPGRKGTEILLVIPTTISLLPDLL